MSHQYHPYTPAAFLEQTGLQASDNEAIYLRWVNTQLNYANFQNLQNMNQQLTEISRLLREGNLLALAK